MRHEPSPRGYDEADLSGDERREPWESRSREELEQVSRDVMLGILRSLRASSFRVEKGRSGGFHCTFFEGQLADQLGLTTKDVFGKPVEEVFPEQVHNQLQGRLERALVGEVQEWIVEYGGRHYEFNLPAAGLFSGDSAVGSIADVTDRIVTDDSKSRLMERLEKAHRQVEQLNYTLSHDLRNPLTVILSMCEVAEREIKKGQGDPVTRLRKIRQAAGRMNELLTDILKLSRSERVELDSREVDVSSMARDVLNELASTQPERRVDIRIQPGLETYADSNLLRDLLENLLSNAWKFTQKEDKPQIRVGGETKDDKHWVCVRDNGIGFAAAEREDLFTAFKRLDSASDFRGTGVGLATVKRIVERHGGQVRGKGRLGEGAKFCFWFPSKEEAAPEVDQDDLEVSSLQ